MPTQTLRLEGQDCADPGLRGRRARALLVVGVVVLALVPSVGVTGALAAGPVVAVFPGDSIQALVNANPAGTTFLIKAGVHRRQHVIPKNDNSFVGEPGAVLTGEDVTAYAFTGTAVRVTIRNLVVEHYNSPSSDYPIKCSSAGYWTVEGNEIRYNAHIGLGAGPRWVVRNNYIHHNGQMGIFAAGEDILIEGNEIAFNNTDGHSPQWEAGGSKFVYTIRLTVRNNFVHDNAGPGLWTDINNIHTLYEGNRVIGNDGPGIFHEISYDAVIRNNLVEGNGYGSRFVGGIVEGSGILINSSQSVEVYGNTVRGNHGGISGINSDRSPDPAELHGAWVLRNLNVHDNTVVMDAGENGIVRYNNADPVWSSRWNNRYDYNTYTLSGAARYYRWNTDARTAAEWQSYGQDPNGTWTTNPPIEPPTCNGLPATMVGTDAADRLTGTPGPDVIVALGGDDVVEGGDGDDVICGGPGDDTLKGGPGDDVLIGGAGHDLLHGQTGQDRLTGGRGRDRLYGGPDTDALYGGSGNDVLRGGGDNDRLVGGEGHNRIL